MLKLQHLAIIFIVIVVPLVIILSYYVDTQLDSITLQNSYDTKLLNATYDAIAAFELNNINNVEFRQVSATEVIIKDHSSNAESLRRDINASVNSFTNSLANNFGVGGYGKKYVMQYIPAMVYTLYDGYYIYTPAEISYIENGSAVKKVDHILKPYIYYTARYKSGTDTDFVINYSLDNYVVVYGTFNGEYDSKAGYLICENKYSDLNFTDEDKEAKNYLEEAKDFSNWFKDHIGGKSLTRIDVEGESFDSGVFNFSLSNDPEDKTSDFYNYKSEIIKKSIQTNLNAAISNYSKLYGESDKFKMPVLSEVEWDKMVSNVSLITFMQGLKVGYNTYNNYMIVSSSGNKQYVNPADLYFESSGDIYHHRINCPELSGNDIQGFKSIDFRGIYRTLNQSDIDDFTKNGWNVQEGYYFKHDTYHCYKCIVSSEIGDFDVNSLGSKKNAYYKALFKERYNQVKLSSYVNDARKDIE